MFACPDEDSSTAIETFRQIIIVDSVYCDTVTCSCDSCLVETKKPLIRMSTDQPRTPLREDIIFASMDGGADDVSAINGASMSALSPISLNNDYHTATALP